MRTIITLCRVAVIALVVTGCGLDIFTPMGTTYVTIANKSSYNLRMEEYDQDDSPPNIKETIIKKNESISYERLGTFGAPSPQRGNVTVFYNTDTGKSIKKFERRDAVQSEMVSYYKLTKKRGEPHSYSNPEEAWYLLEITDEILR